jgi:Flp pilus assembly protein TadD
MDLHHDEQYDEAIAAFQKSIEEGYREEASTYNIACGYALKGDKDRAFEWLRKANEVGFPVAKYLTDDDLDSLHSDPRWAALRKELRENPSSEARAEKRHANERYQKLLTDSKARPSRYFEMGKALYNAEEYAASAKAYHRSAELGYRGGTSSYNEACSLSLNGDKAAALDALQRAIENGFDQPDMFRKDDDLDNVRGERRFKELQALAEELEGPSLSWGGHILKSEERHEWKKAADHARQVAAKYPQYGRAWYNLGFAEIKGEHPEAAAPAFLKALELGYRKSTTLYNLACSYSLMGQKDQAFDYLFKAVDAGFDENHTLRHDDDLDNLRGDPRYRQALRRVESKDEGTEEN